MKAILLLSVLFALTISGLAGTLPGILSVRIMNTRTDWFYLEELEILNTDGVDIASLDFGATAEASEIPGFGGHPDGPIDDMIGDCCATGYHSSAASGDQSVTITFPTPQTITGEIRVWDRQDSSCCTVRLDGMLFEYFDGPNATGNLIAGQEVVDLALNTGTDVTTEMGAAFEVTNPDSDSDGDGLTNRFETSNGLDPNDSTGDNGADGDPDNDASTNLEEFTRETNPQVADTDADGVLDGAETGSGVWVSVTDTGTDPLNPDSDGDSLLDGVETNTAIWVDALNTGTNPFLKDSDGDSFVDGREVSIGTNPNDPTSFPVVLIAISGVKSVRITNTQTNWFYLEELELRNALDQDVASLEFGTTATGTENPGFGGRFTGPIDDDIGNCCASGYHSSTDQEGQVLTFTFPTPQDLAGDIRVWNRQDGCCFERLDSMLFEFFDGDDGTGNLIAEQIVEGIATEQSEIISTAEGAAVPLVNVTPRGPLTITRVALQRPNQLGLAWSSNPGEFFSIDRSNDLLIWEEFTSSMPSSSAGMETAFTVDRLAGDSASYFRIRRAQAPPFLSADFENDVIGWTTGISETPFPNEGATRFELGAPTTGPSSAHSGTQVFATDLDANYDNGLNIVLTSPVIDLSLQRRATLTFWYVLQGGTSEGARLEIIDEGNAGAVLAQTDVFAAASNWTMIEVDLTKVGPDGVSVVGKSIRLRYQFLSDSVSEDNGAGFYLDDVLVEK